LRAGDYLRLHEVSGHGRTRLLAGGLALGARGDAAWRAARAQKLLVNAVLNPLAALLGAEHNGALGAALRPGGGAPRALAEALAADAFDALRADAAGAGAWPVRDAADALDAARAAAAATAANVNSALADARAGRLGEGDFISGAVLAALSGGGRGRGEGRGEGRGGDDGAGAGAGGGGAGRLGSATQSVLDALRARERALGVRTAATDARAASVIEAASAFAAAEADAAEAEAEAAARAEAV